MPTPQTATKPDTADMFDEPENPAEDAFVPPNFEQMKVVDLKLFVKDNYLGDAIEEICKLKKAELIERLKLDYPHPDALDTPTVTGYDPADPIHQTVASVQALKSEEDAIAFVPTMHRLRKWGRKPNRMAIRATARTPAPTPLLRRS